MLADSPEDGAACDSIKMGYRKFPNGSHVIFYRNLSDTEIEIVRILHKRMDLARQLEGAERPDNGRMLAAKIAKPQKLGVTASAASLLIDLLGGIAF
ncbi:type II toxin-antitoxin system RelE/ParE family toxin [Parahaliea mediterranea]|uniref:type II toxin-antitoxin system RelE/ParE family toxin n=1 Tax=Parahaliea mediterranea TaxID=651086 RepID=UPI001F4EAB19|nr:type II toxin-antitoxin system RelE/ParE family toxin [Parahaliea mediterranea]